LLNYEKLIASFRNDRLCDALSRHLKRARRTDRGGIANEAAWEAKKSTGGEECRKRLLTPSSHIDTFLQAFCPSEFCRGTCVMYRECQSVGWPAAPRYTRATCIPYFAFPSRFATGIRRSGREIAQMKFQWKVSACRAARLCEVSTIPY